MLTLVLLIDLFAFLTGFLIITVLPLLFFSTFVAAGGGYANLAKSDERFKAIVRSSLVGSALFLIMYYVFTHYSRDEIGLFLDTIFRIWLVRLAGGCLVGCPACWWALLTRKRERALNFMATAISTGAGYIVFKSLVPVMERPSGWHTINLLLVLGPGVHLLLGGVTRPGFRLLERLMPDSGPGSLEDEASNP